MKILFENGPDQAEALRVTRQRLVAAFAGREHLLEGVECIVSDSEADWLTHAPAADVIFLGRHVAPPTSPGRRSPLRWVQSISAGVEDLVSALPEGVLLTNASGVHAEKGGEFILAATLMLNYGIPRFATDKTRRLWRPEFGSPLSGKCVVLLGVGAIGSAAAAHLRHLGARTWGVSRSGRSSVDLERIVPVDRIDELLPEADFLVSSIPLSASSRGLVDRRRLGLLPGRAGVVVVGRSLVFDYAALQDALRSGRLSGAVLDVFDREPIPPHDPIWSCPNLIITPHCSLDDHASYLGKCLDLFVENLRRFRSDEPLTCVVDRELGY